MLLVWCVRNPAGFSEEMWGGQSCPQPAFRPAGPAAKRVRRLKSQAEKPCPTFGRSASGRAERRSGPISAKFQLQDKARQNAGTAAAIRYCPPNLVAEYSQDL